MSITPIKPEKIVEKRKGLFIRLLSMIIFTIREKLIKSKLFLILYLIYTFVAVIGTVLLVIFSDILSFLPIPGKSDALAVYYALLLFGFGVTLLNDLAFWIVAFSSSNLLSDEIKSSNIIIYYSKPIPRYFYILSRFLSIFLIIFIVAVIPIIVMSTVPVIRNEYLAQYFTQLDILKTIFISILASVITLSFYILFVFAISAIVEDRGASVLISFIIYYSSYILGFSLSIYVDKSFIVLSMGFWVTSIIITLLGIPWMDINFENIERIGRFLMLPNLKLPPVIYLIGSFAVIIVMEISAIIIFRKIGLLESRG